MCSPTFIYPIALIPVYVGLSTAIEQLTTELAYPNVTDRELYFSFLYTSFQKAYPEFAEKAFAKQCQNKAFRLEQGLAILRILAMTQYTYKNPAAVLPALKMRNSLVRELSGTFPGPALMLYYGSDMLRMGLGSESNLVDPSGENMEQALFTLGEIHKVCRRTFQTVAAKSQIVVNMEPIVTIIKEAGDGWEGGRRLRELCEGLTVKANNKLTEGIVVLGERGGSVGKDDVKAAFSMQQLFNASRKSIVDG